MAQLSLPFQAPLFSTPHRGHHSRIIGRIVVIFHFPLFKGGKSIMIPRILANNLSSLWKREAGRDFWKGRFDPLNCYAFPDFQFGDCRGRDEK
jgi:hypothetical protein